jgi:hypothetical protein
MKAVRIFYLVLLFIISCNTEYVKFRKIIWDEQNENFVEDKYFSDKFQSNVIYVLDVFKEKYYVEKGMLYISRKLWNDKETLWNYCNKADGDEWINQRERRFQELEAKRKNKPIE